MKKQSKGIIVLIIILVLLIVVAGVLLLLKIGQTNSQKMTVAGSGENGEEGETGTVIEMKEPTTFKGVDRPIAVMIDNHKAALPQAGLNDAYLVYEIIVEGGESRLMAVFKGKDIEKIGPVRSARHYFLDYALENDAIYVHFGWSPQAEADIKKLGVNNINGIYYDGGRDTSASFWRVKDKSAPHNAVTNTAKIKKLAQKLKYSTASSKDSLLTYVVDPVDLGETAGVADTVTIPYSESNKVSYTYDAETKRYIRYSKGVKETDWTTGELVTTKNIIITKCKNWTLNDGENKDRQTIDNIKTLDGYYVTEGKYIPITCEKTSRSSQTIYKDLNGKEIEVNDGNTFIQICPINSKVTFEQNPSVEE